MFRWSSAGIIKISNRSNSNRSAHTAITPLSASSLCVLSSYPTPVESYELARYAAEAALSKKARDIVLLDVSSLSDVTDYFVLCTGDSDTQVKAISDAVEDQLFAAERSHPRKEGTMHLQWVLLDYFNVVVHVFQPRVREFYDLERLWGDAVREDIADDAPVRA
jgi:ribosome-associated protein